jgi:hypothetical protein
MVLVVTRGADRPPSRSALHGSRVRSLLTLGLSVIAGVAALSVATAGPARAEVRCATVRYAFQPDCFEPPCTKPKRKLGDRLDLGPQIAVWVEAADHSRVIDTVLVTNLTAKYGIANRPGRPDLPSGPKHPYGKRLMALPVWAWARGKLYPQIVMQDGKEDWMGFHEVISSPDPYFCRPMGLNEVDVDAITCPTVVFNSAKGTAAPDRSTVPYPPRNDLVNFTDHDCDQPRAGMGCSKVAEGFSMLNDLDAVAAATPAFDRVFESHWTVPGGVKPTDDLAFLVEVNREFDQNPAHTYPAYNDRMLSDNGFTQTGLHNNLGQPSVVYRIPFRTDGSQRFGATAVAAGYGRADGATGAMSPMDSTISQSSGSGEGRLRSIPMPWPDGPAGQGRLFVRLDDCREGDQPDGECQPAPPPPPAVSDLEVIEQKATTATLAFRHSSDDGMPVAGYEIRLLHSQADSEENFLEGVPKPVVDPATPGTMATFTINELKPLTPYVIAVRALGRCGTRSALAQRQFSTGNMNFTQLTGCFIATAAYGSALAPAVTQLRAVRDRARGFTALAAAAIDLYERASPPLAALLGRSDASRAVVRQVLAPAVELAGAGAAPTPKR